MPNSLSVPTREQPRERLERLGHQALSLQELIAILIGSGTKGQSVFDLSAELVNRFGGIEGLSHATLEELMEVKGLGRANSLKLHAAIALAKRLESAKLPDYPMIASPDDAARYLRPLFDGCREEQIAILLRDVKGRAFKRLVIGKGILNSVIAHPREIFAPAIAHRAKSLIIAHNHPSGDPTPSKSDLTLTERLLQAGRFLGVPVDDHLILAFQTHGSFYQMGILQSRDLY